MKEREQKGGGRGFSTVFFLAGGTGGHIFPALSVANKLRSEVECRVVFIGIGREIEKKILRNSGFEYKILPFVPVLGGGIKGLFRMLLVFPLLLFAACVYFF